jgi:hypothetical protein
VKRRVLVAEYWLVETPDGCVGATGWTYDRHQLVAQHPTKSSARSAWAYRLHTGDPGGPVTFVHVRRWRKQ